MTSTSPSYDELTVWAAHPRVPARLLSWADGFSAPTGHQSILLARLASRQVHFASRLRPDCRRHRPEWLDGKVRDQTTGNATGLSIEPPPTAPSQRRLLGVVEEGGDLSDRDVRLGQVALGEVVSGLVL